MPSEVPVSMLEDSPASGEGEYTPRTPSRRRGIGLCLSGGGYRAVLFHLGALRRLNELGILAHPDLRTVSAVSGGSMAAAHLASTLAWPLSGPVQDWEARVAAPLRAFTRTNIRTRALLKRLSPGNLFGKSPAVEELAARLTTLTPLRLHDLPERPNFVFCATDMAFGASWVFEKRRVGDYQAGYVAPPPDDWPLARAVAASACFPPIFNPLPLRFRPEEYAGGLAYRREREKWTRAIRDLRLNDGGNYDNMALEPVWKDHAVVLVSDASSRLDFAPDHGLLRRLMRYVAIQGHQSLALRKRWLISNFLAGVMDGAYWGIRSARESYGLDDAAGYSKELAEDVIARVRTDLDAFSDAKPAVLENHLADAAIQQHARAGMVPSRRTEAEIRGALRDSGRRTLLGRR